MINRLYQIAFICLTLLFLSSCGRSKPNAQIASELIERSSHHLYSSGVVTAPLLILFPGMGGDAAGIQQEIDLNNQSAVSVLYMNYGNRLAMNEKDCSDLEALLQAIIQEQELKPQSIAIGGFSAGGIVTCYLSNYLVKTKSEIAPNKAFVVDSPLDLQDLYYHVTDVDSNSNPISIQEAEFVRDYFSEWFHADDSLSSRIAEISPFCLSTSNARNAASISNIAFRLYTEPDANWWMENRNIEYEATNAFQLESIYNMVRTQGWDKIELIKTKDKGYRANGERHPHSWSIVDSKELIEWVAKD